MNNYIPVFMIGIGSMFVLFAPPATIVFKQHPECSIAGFSPDLTQKQRAFCREWSKK
ncbi:hypothetical protein UFOVP15_46 [uncultured Caudovirales phage]|uniref:Uncharacterized protein n=1 Tax=uncultured Caudovirales phage TaxID=2100421 RepID=A0A6J5KHT2_9CAUD|nr:hypothetical protein UFOVP15_46 [uncultured Caudovirales phage]